MISRKIPKLVDSCRFCNRFIIHDDKYISKDIEFKKKSSRLIVRHKFCGVS